MLSAGASNALLKTLEEPPEHVVFVLATTDPQKVLAHDPVAHAALRVHALHARRARRAPRRRVRAGRHRRRARRARRHRARRAPARCATRCRCSTRRSRTARSTSSRSARCSAAPRSSCACAVLDAVADEDVAGALVALGELLDAGHDPRRLTEDLLATARDAFLLTSAQGPRARRRARGRRRARSPRSASRSVRALLVRMLETLGQAVVDMRGTDAADPRLVLEIALVRLARRDAGPPLQALADRVDRLERQLAAGAAHRRRAPRPAPTPAPAAPARHAWRSDPGGARAAPVGSGEDDRRTPSASAPRSRRRRARAARAGARTGARAAGGRRRRAAASTSTT